jgi:SAM-dependent methyltransferase
MPRSGDIRKTRRDSQWYRTSWTLEIQDMSWVEQTAAQVDFVCGVLELRGRERILDLACGFGRHSLELARRGFHVVGVDITADYIDEARKRAEEEGLDTEFVCADLSETSYRDEFDVVLNLADGAIGYLEDDAQNLRVFDTVSLALKQGGKHLMDVCNAAYAAKHFPRRGWEVGSRGLSLSDFEWDSASSRMVFGGVELKYGEVLTKPEEISCDPVRLYTLPELEAILRNRGMVVRQAFGDYDRTVAASDDQLQLLVYSQKQSATAS